MSNKIELRAGQKSSTKPRGELEIQRDWCPDLDAPVVSVACVTYNHCNYISDALDGFLAQETNFPFEIIVRDDASTDGTQDILRSYAEKYPNIIRLHLEEENQWGKGVRPFPKIISLARSNYIAFCDGDDYWISPHKLQIQYEAMQKNPECDLCFHKAWMVDCVNDNSRIIGQYRQGAGRVDAASVIRYEFGALPTAAMMVTRRAATQFVEFRSRHTSGGVGDILLQIFAVSRGAAYYVDGDFSVYRKFSDGSWSVAQSQSSQARLAKFKTIIRYFELLKEHPEIPSNLTKDIDCAIRLQLLLMIYDSDIESVDKRRVLNVYEKYLDLPSRMIAIAICRVPGSLAYIRRIWSAAKPVRVASTRFWAKTRQHSD